MEADLNQASALSPSSMQCNRSSSPQPPQGKEANQQLPRKKALPDIGLTDLDRCAPLF